MATWTDTSPTERHRFAEAWLGTFNAALASKDCARVAAMMHADGYWRDLLTFGWDFKTLHGVDQVRTWLAEVLPASPAHDSRLDGEPAIGGARLEAGGGPSHLPPEHRREPGCALGRAGIAPEQVTNGRRKAVVADGRGGRGAGLDARRMKKGECR